MSRLLELLDEAHRVENAAGFKHTLAIVQRKTNRRTLESIANEYRRAADLVETAARLLNK